jgi:putative transposase
VRRPRLHVPGACYHVTLRGNHRQDIFLVDADRQLLEGFVAKALEHVGARVHAYCWMSNHVHLLVQIAETPLGDFVQRVATRFARAVQSRVPTTGHLFENRYHALLVDVDRYFMTLLRYIHLNPVRAGLVADPADYLWSGHRAYLGLARNDWLETRFGLRMFAQDIARARDRYQAFVLQGLGDTGDRSSLAPNAGEPRVLGDDAFLTRVAAAGPARAVDPGLEKIAATIALELGVPLERIRSPSQQRELSRARGLLAARALAAGAASLSDIARFLNRSASAVTRAAERYGSDGSCKTCKPDT